MSYPSQRMVKLCIVQKARSQFMHCSKKLGVKLCIVQKALSQIMSYPS